jgi:hypothetical protein
MKLRTIRNQQGSMLVETVLILAGGVLPVMLAATSLAQVLDVNSKLQLVARQGSRSFVLASSNAAGLSAIEAIKVNQQVLFELPLSVKTVCTPSCIAGGEVETTAEVELKLISVPLLPDLKLKLNRKVVATIDKYVER